MYKIKTREVEGKNETTKITECGKRKKINERTKLVFNIGLLFPNLLANIHRYMYTDVR